VNALRSTSRLNKETGSVELKIFSKSKGNRRTTDVPSISEFVPRRRKGLLTLTTPRVILDALGLPGSVVPLSKRTGMSCVMGDVILEAEMVAFSDTTERIDGKSYPCYPRLSHIKPFFRVLENSESRREHRSRSEAQSS
jgi:hypothetical protein